MAKSVKELLNSLTVDKWRETHPFSPDIETANKVLLHPAATRAEKADALSTWLQKNQPCLFGRLAARQGRNFYCILDDSDLEQDDDYIHSRIQGERKLWKHRALTGDALSADGFMLVAVSEKILRAAPDENLRNLSQRLRDLWISESDPDDGDTFGPKKNDYVLESLFLKKPAKDPADDEYYRFTFTADYFAAAGDGRWWHDHRIPGGIGFSANSLGHMLRRREWYEGEAVEDVIGWGLRTAMQTIASAQQTKWGTATWLLPLDARQQPKKHDLVPKCPFASSMKLPAMIQDKDWTAYAGWHHTDHSLRYEYFTESEEPVRKGYEWLMDFSYIYRKQDSDYVQFMGGELTAKDDLDKEIGSIADRRVLSANAEAAVKSDAERIRDRKKEDSAAIDASMKDCRLWEMSAAELQAITAL